MHIFGWWDAYWNLTTLTLHIYRTLYRYNAVNFLQNIHEKRPIAHPSGRGMGCILWIQPLIDILPQFLQWCVQYFLMLDCVITALDCIGELTPAWTLQMGASILRCRLTSIRIPIIKIRRYYDRLIFIMGIPIHRKTVSMVRRDPEWKAISDPYLRTLGRDPRDTIPYVQISFDWAL